MKLKSFLKALTVISVTTPLALTTVSCENSNSASAKTPSNGGSTVVTVNKDISKTNLTNLNQKYFSSYAVVTTINSSSVYYSIKDIVLGAIINSKTKLNQDLAAVVNSKLIVKSNFQFEGVYSDSSLKNLVSDKGIGKLSGKTVYVAISGVNSLTGNLVITWQLKTFC